MDKDIVDLGASHIYIAPDAPHTNLNLTAPAMVVRVSNNELEKSAASADLPIPQLACNFLANDHIMLKSIKHLLVLDQSVMQIEWSSTPNKMSLSFFQVTCSS